MVDVGIQGLSIYIIRRQMIKHSHCDSCTATRVQVFPSYKRQLCGAAVTMRIILSFPLARLANVIALAHAAMAYWTELGREGLSFRPVEVAPPSLIIFFV